MLAPVLSQPALPLNDTAGLEIAPHEIRAVRERIEHRARGPRGSSPTASKLTGSLEPSALLPTDFPNWEGK